MASKINNLDIYSNILFMQHFQLLKSFLLYVHVKMASFNSVRPRDRGSGSGSSRPRVVFGSTVEINS